jgi:hypothetical protein
MPLFPLSTGGSGGVSSVAFTAPASVFAVAGSPITSTGTIALTFNTQAANQVLAGPTSGGAAVPAFRALVAADIPDLSGSYQPLDAKLTAFVALANAAGVLTNDGAGGYSWASAGGSGTVTSVALTVPAFLSVAGSPVTTAGTLAVTLANQSANLIFAGPSTGSAAAPTFRSLVVADIPAESSLLDRISSTQGTILFRSASAWSALAPGTSGNVLKTNGAAADPTWTTAGGDVVGPAGAGDIAIARYNGTTGKIIQDSNVFISGGGDVGLGTAIPNFDSWGRALTVYYSGTSSVGLELANTADADTAGVGGMEWIQNNWVRRNLAQIYVNQSGSTAADRGARMRFFTKPDAGAAVQAMEITAKQNLLIGTTDESVFSTGGNLRVNGALVLGTALAIAQGGTGQITAAAAINALLPSQTGNAGKILATDGSNVSWSGAGSGDVVGPGSSGTGRLAVFSGTTGKVLQDNSGIIASSNTLTSTSSFTLAAGGSNQNMVLTPSGTGFTILNGAVGMGTTTPNYDSWGNAMSLYVNSSSSAVGFEFANNADTDGQGVGGFEWLQPAWTNKGLAQIYVSQSGATSGNRGANMRFFTKLNGAAQREVARLSAAGNFLVGGTADTGLTGAGGISVFSTTSASSATTGALIVAGGIGCAHVTQSGTFTFTSAGLIVSTGNLVLTPSANTIINGAHLGVGTASPNIDGWTRALTLFNNGTGSLAYEIGNTANADGAGVGGMEWVASSWSNKGIAQIYVSMEGATSADRGTNMRFYTKANGAAQREVARITTSGNLLLGSTSETGVVGIGGLKVSGNLFMAGATTAPGSNPASGFYIYVDSADSKLKARGTSGTITVLAVP